MDVKEVVDVPDGIPNGGKESQKFSFVAIHNKVRHPIEFESEKTILELKSCLEKLIGVSPSMQKIMVKGLAKDEFTLAQAGVTQGCKIMVIGSKVTDLLSVAAPSDRLMQETSERKIAEAIRRKIQLHLQSTEACIGTEKEELVAAPQKEKLSQQKAHRKVLDKGIPEDVAPGVKGLNEPLPPIPLKGMVNKQNNKVRLTFKLEDDQLWIGTKDRTDKISMSSIKSVVSEPIEGHEEYHIMGIQLGPTEASRYWIYWVPAQFTEAIKETVLGKW